MTEQNPGVPASFAPGSRIAGYLLEEQIGHGGMAVVFRAHDQRLDRTVALKILAPELSEDEVFRQRFIRESRAAAATDDPHIIPVFEAGEASGALFIAMRFVRGGDVRSLIRQTGPLPPGRATEIIAQVASALDAAHARGLVHRDVKPANMLLDGGSGAGRPDHVYLSDFGLSKGSLQASELTGTGIFLGTLDYISPEQIESKPVDGRADQYALACAAFEMLTGTAPFRRDEAMAVMYAQLSEPPPTMSSYRRTLPASADPVVARALSKAPADRYGSCREFAGALRAALGPQPYAYADAATILPGPIPGADSGPGGVQTSQGQLPEHWLLGGAGDGGRRSADDSTAGGRSPRRKSVIAIVAAIATVALLVAGGAAAIGLTNSKHGDAGSGGTKGASGRTGNQLRRPALKPPGCARTVAAGKELGPVPAARVRGHSGGPFGIAVSSDGKAVFAVTDGAVRVYRASGGTLTATGSSYPVGSAARKATTATMTRDGRYLLVASDSGIKVLDAPAAEHGDRHAILGTLKVPGSTKYGRAIGVAVTPDDKFAFVSLQFRDQVGVFNLGKALRENFGRGGKYYVGSLKVGAQPVGLTMSPDGDTLYATAFLGNSAVPGILSVIDVVRATNPAQLAQAMISQVKTGCDPARIAVTSDGGTVWVTARESNYLLGYSAAELRRHPQSALIAKVRVGSQPIGIAIVSGGKRIVVSDDNNSASSLPQPGDLAVVDAAAALSGKQALLGYIPASLTPHELATSPDGRTLYVTNYDGTQIQIIDIASLP